MAIAKSVNPTFVLHGTVNRVNRRTGRRKDGSEWGRLTIELEQPHGAKTDVIVWDDFDGRQPIEAPEVGSFFAANVTIRESGRDAEVHFDSWPFDVLDLIQSALSGKSSKAA